MTREKHQELVRLVREKSTLKPPEATYNNYDNWRNNATLARLLTSHGLNYPQEAIEVFREVVKDTSDLNFEDIYVDTDLMAWALRDLSMLERDHGEKDLSLAHIDQAINLAEYRDADYSFTVRGNLMYHKFLTLCSLGREQEAETMAEAMIAEHKNSKALNDSYIFYGYIFKARLAAENGNSDKVKQFMLKALDGIDSNETLATESRANLEAIDIANVPPKDLFDKMYRALPDAFNGIAWWDMIGNPPWEKENKDKV